MPGFEDKVLYYPEITTRHDGPDTVLMNVDRGTEVKSRWVVNVGDGWSEVINPSDEQTAVSMRRIAALGNSERIVGQDEGDHIAYEYDPPSRAVGPAFRSLPTRIGPKLHWYPDQGSDYPDGENLYINDGPVWLVYRTESVRAPGGSILSEPIVHYVKGFANTKQVREFYARSAVKLIVAYTEHTVNDLLFGEQLAASVEMHKLIGSDKRTSAVEPSSENDQYEISYGENPPDTKGVPEVITIRADTKEFWVYDAVTMPEAAAMFYKAYKREFGDDPKPHYMTFELPF